MISKDFLGGNVTHLYLSRGCFDTSLLKLPDTDGRAGTALTEECRTFAYFCAGEGTMSSILALIPSSEGDWGAVSRMEVSFWSPQTCTFLVCLFGICVARDFLYCFGRALSLRTVWEQCFGNLNYGTTLKMFYALKSFIFCQITIWINQIQPILIWKIKIF